MQGEYLNPSTIAPAPIIVIVVVVMITNITIFFLEGVKPGSQVFLLTIFRQCFLADVVLNLPFLKNDRG